MYTSSNYVKKYSDLSAMTSWLEKHITGSDTPPVTFQVNGKSSSDYTWEKTVGKIEKIIYFEQEDNPSESCQQIINYVCKQLSLRIQLTLIRYTDYPLIEYSATLFNESEQNSPLISNLLSANYEIENKNGDYFLHASRGANTQYNDFEPLTYQLKQAQHFEVTNGKPTSTYLPYFNLENKVENTGVI